MKTTPKDFFLHLFTVVALYSSAIALINLAFSIVNFYNPDALAGYFSVGSVAWPISILVVMVPILYAIEWLLERDLAKIPEKKDIWIRKWRVYLTLFLAGLAIVIDLITLINTYLNGEITNRFVYKVLIVIAVAGAVFAYYLLTRTTDSINARNWRKILAWAGIVLVLAAIVGGFTIVGSPGKQRALRFDGERVGDLQNIQYRILNYWQQKKVLPTALANLNDPISNFTVPTDPDTKAQYEYSVKSANTPASSAKPAFELCATFALESQDASGRGAYNGYGGYDMSYPVPAGSANDSWAHPAGHACFERTIDPSLYSLDKTVPKPAI